MRHYEICFIVHPDQSEQVPGMVERYRTIVTAQGGSIHRAGDQVVYHQGVADADGIARPCPSGQVDQALADGIKRIGGKHIFGGQAKAGKLVRQVALQVVAQRLQGHKLAALGHFAQVFVLRGQAHAQLGLGNQAHAQQAAHAVFDF